MTGEIDDQDRKLLQTLQKGLPVVSRPFQYIADELGWTEEAVLQRLTQLNESNMIRKFGAVLNPKRMGYKSLLAAVNVDEERIHEVAAVINTYPGVTHNYLRDGEPNVWFTMTEPSQEKLDNNLAEIELKTGLPIIRMPMTKMFKIGVKLDL